MTPKHLSLRGINRKLGCGWVGGVSAPPPLVAAVCTTAASPLSPARPKGGWPERVVVKLIALSSS